VNQLYEFGPFRLDPEERTLWRGGEAVPLTVKAFETLLALVEGGGRVVGKEELMGRVWPDSFVEENNLAQQISYLRRALGEAESGVKYIETVPKRGYRFVVSPREVEGGGAGLVVRESIRAHVLVEEEETDDGADGAGGGGAKIIPARPAEALPQPAPALAGAAATGKRVPTALLLACAVVALAALAYLAYNRWAARQRADAGPRTLAILPFRNLRPDAETDFLGFSLADAIITKLGYVSTVIVRPSSYVDKYRNQAIDPKAVAADLNVNTLLTGSYVREGDDLRISAQLVDVGANEILWRDQLDLKYEKLLTVQDRVARRVIEGLRLKLSPAEAQRLALDAPHDPLAYEYYLRGVDLYSANDFKLAVEMFKKSVALDPNYSLAWAHLGTAYTAEAAFSFGGREDYRKALEAYDRALALNPEQIEARIFQANLYTDTNRVAQAVPVLREVLKTNPNYALAHWELGYAYRFAGMLDESIAECELARSLDPQVKLHSSALNAYLYSGQYEKFLRSLPPDEDVAFIVFYRGLARLYLKDDAGAAADFDRAYELNPSLYTQIGKALSYAVAGDRRKGLELLTGTEKKMDERGVSDAEAMYKTAQAYALLGDRPAALRMLRRGIEGGFFCYPYMRDDPLLADLRGEPAYAALLESARKSHEEFSSRFF
jgi:DNA-binding winged helix-turn-helix (wHTH) protein/TolB-like protein